MVHLSVWDEMELKIEFRPGAGDSRL
jgi:hypothetical protein